MASRKRLGLLAALLVLPVASGPAAFAQASRPPASAVSLPDVGTCTVTAVIEPDGRVGYAATGQGWTKFVRVHLTGRGGMQASAVPDAKGAFSVSLARGPWSATQPVISSASVTCAMAGGQAEPPDSTTPTPQPGRDYQRGYQDGWRDIKGDCTSNSPPPPDASAEYAKGYKSAAETASGLFCESGSPKPSAPPPPG